MIFDEIAENLICEVKLVSGFKDYIRKNFVGGKLKAGDKVSMADLVKIYEQDVEFCRLNFSQDGAYTVGRLTYAFKSEDDIPEEHRTGHIGTLLAGSISFESKDTFELMLDDYCRGGI